MGNGYYYHCEKCGEHYDVRIGAGMAFPEVYRQTFKDVPRHRLGAGVVRHFGSLRRPFGAKREHVIPMSQGA